MEPVLSIRLKQLTVVDKQLQHKYLDILVCLWGLHIGEKVLHEFR